MGARRARRCSLLHLPRLATCILFLLLPLSCSASVITHLPGFNGHLPFHLETGYVGVDDETGTKLFYYFVESERSPSTDPVLLWLTGGPGCSGFSGVVFEVGPMKYVLAPYNDSLPQLVYNQYSWTQVASILFLDTPVGSGFSYAHDPRGYNVGDISSSLQVVKFLKKWFSDHPRYLLNHFYVGGSSYAGKGYIVGNPITGSKIDYNFNVAYSHGVGIISDQLYEAAVANCNGDYVTATNELCANALDAINKLISEVDQGNILDDKCVRATPKPVNDVSGHRTLLEDYIRLSEPSVRPTINCFSYRYYLSYLWMNDNTVREALKIKKVTHGISSAFAYMTIGGKMPANLKLEDTLHIQYLGTVGEWIRCKTGIPYAMDVASSIKYHFNLTTRGYRALVFSGDHDLMVPFLSTQAWIRSLNFSIVDDWRAWHVDDQAAGYTIMYDNNLTFATVKGGGHTSIETNPKQGFALGQRWLDNKPL
uniref:carboxypeptidase D n=1 Tax=Leersia perrieri TaxID=77586 RepID=A0A0D9VYK5_9ORYZ